jgi:hypothetical protein
MTGVSGIGKIAQAIRAHAALAHEKPLAGGPASAGGITQEQSQARPSDFKTQVAVRLKAIRSDDPLRRRKAFRIFLESTLADLVGSEAPSDPAFQALIDRVHLAMDDDPCLAAELVRTADLLLDSSVR